MKIAIIGAGVSGLLTAYLLKRKNENAQIYLLDKSDRIGGNVETRRFKVGQSYISEQHDTRWADMGVNDFNLDMYTNIYNLLQMLGYEKKTNLLKLENSTSFSNDNGSISYYINDDGKNTMPQIVYDDYKRFQNEGSKHLLKDSGSHDLTVEQFLERHEYSREFAEYNLYPRINGMYFVNDSHPKYMPIKAVMDYYHLQEGFGAQDPHPYRVYLKGGMSEWLRKLFEHSYTKFVKATNIELYANTDSVKLRCDQFSEVFDAAFISCPADSANEMIKAGKTEEMKDVFSAFTYTKSTSIAHTYAPVLPPDRSAWKTYNIYIHGKKETYRPYTISYVCNRHQNDKNNPDYDNFENPEYFVSLNPHKQIPESFILKDVNGNPMIQTFRHYIFNENVLRVQNNGDITKIQGQNNLFFAGGWMQGAGLHEQCYYAANQAVNKFVFDEIDLDEYYTPGAPPEEYAPKYLREKFSHFFDQAET